MNRRLRGAEATVPVVPAGDGRLPPCFTQNHNVRSHTMSHGPVSLQRSGGHRRRYAHRRFDGGGGAA